VGKAESQDWAKKDYACLQENHSSEADECRQRKKLSAMMQARWAEEEGGVEV
jgi:hypothetical protein